MVLAQIVDTGIGSLADILKDFTVSFWGVVLFIGISVVSGFGQYTTLGMVKSKNKEKEIRKMHFNILEKIVTIVQYILLAILGFVVLQILLSSEYSTIILKVGVVIGYTAISSRRHRVANLVRKIKTVLENVLDGKFVPHGTYGINHSKHDLEYGYLIVGLMQPSGRRTATKRGRT